MTNDLAALIQRLQDDDPDERLSAVRELGDLQEATPEVITVLVATLAGDQSLRFAAAIALGKLGQPTPEVLAALLTALQDPSENRDVRGVAAQAFGKFGPAAATPEVVTALTAGLNDKEVRVRSHAERALSQLGPKGATSEVLRIMSERLPMTVAARRNSSDNENFYEFNGVVSTIALFGEAAATPEVLAALCAGLKDRDDEVSALSAYALGEIGPKAATPEVLSALTAALTHVDSLTRELSEAALTKLGHSPGN